MSTAVEDMLSPFPTHDIPPASDHCLTPLEQLDGKELTLSHEGFPVDDSLGGLHNRVSRTLQHLYADAAVLKIWNVGLRGLAYPTPPTTYPEYTSPGGGSYVESPADFWTAGFFPGCLYLLLERHLRWPQKSVHDQTLGTKYPHPLKLQHACLWWTENLHIQATATDTHDLGFLIQPWAQLGWELNQDHRCLRTLITAAYSLATRFDERIGCIRSWDTCYTLAYQYDDPAKDFLVIIDCMMNLDLLFYVSNLNGDSRLARIAATHAATTMESHIRPDNSTFHVVNFDQSLGGVKNKFTNQGFGRDSCWARGQAWAIVGFIRTYRWTKDSRFLQQSKSLADYFIAHLPKDDVPYWDFLAPLRGPRDTSAAVAAVYGMLLIYEADPENSASYLVTARTILTAVIVQSSAADASTSIDQNGAEAVNVHGHDTILLNATINNFEFAPRRFVDHGLVYADYYFLLIGNKLLEMGLDWN